MKQGAMQKWEEQQRLKLMSKKIASAKSVLRFVPPVPTLAERLPPSPPGVHQHPM